MKLWKYEIDKLICQKIIVMLCLCSVFANLFTFYMTEKGKTRYLCKGEDYQTFQQIYAKTQTSVEREKSMQKLLDLNRMYSYKYGEISQNMDEELEANYQSFVQEMTEQYGDGILKELEQFKQNMTIQTSAKYNAYANDWLEQAQYAKKYEQFRNEMENRADQLQEVSIFAKKGSYANKNILKTCQDFKKLGTIEISFDNQYGVKAFLTYRYTGIYLLAVVLILCMGLIQQEKDKHLITLLKSKKKGKLHLFAAKTGALFTGIIFMTFLYHITLYWMASRLYGMGNLSISIQSLSIYRGCCLKLTVGQFMLLCAITQAAAACVMGMLFFACFLLFQKNTYVYIACGALTLIGCGCYFLIPAVSKMAVLKYSNLIAGMQPARLYGNYRNVNVFGNAISVLPVFVITAVVLLFVGLIVGTVSWCHGFEIRINRSISFFSISKRIFGIVNIFWVQLYEFLFYEKKIIFCVILLIYGINSGFFSYTGHLPDKETETEYSHNVEKIEGVLTKETDRTILERENYYERVWDELAKCSDKKNSDAETYAKVLALSYQADIPYRAFLEVQEQYEYLKDREKAGKEAVMLDKYSYNRQFENGASEVEHLMMAGIVTVWLCGTLFADRRKMGKLVLSMKKGRRSLWRRKYIIGICSGIISWMCLVLPNLICFFREKPMYLLSSNLANLQLLSQVKEEYSIGMALGIRYGADLLVCILIACMTMLLVDITNNSLSIMISMTAVLLLSGMLMLRKKTGLFGTVILKSAYPVRNLMFLSAGLLLIIAIPIILWEKEVLYPKGKVEIGHERKCRA